MITEIEILKSLFGNRHEITMESDNLYQEYNTLVRLHNTKI